LTRTAAHLLLFGGLLLVSTAGPFIVLARMDAFAVVFWRSALAALGFGMVALLRGHAVLPRRYVVAVMTGGVLLGAHFLLWVKAFDLTNYASNLLLLVAQPALAALLGIRLGERPTAATRAAVALATTGMLVMAGGDLALGARAILGDGMCVAGGLAICLSYVRTRTARAELPLETFMAYTLAASAAVALPVAVGAHARLISYAGRSWGWMAALVIATTMGGHGLMNLCARHVRLFTLNLVIVLEPAFAIALGAVLFGASITPTQAAGGAILVAAVLVGLRAAGQPAPPLE
jgi:drug/metabolite transporter (DMT)-like permease